MRRVLSRFGRRNGSIFATGTDNGGGVVVVVVTVSAWI